MSFERIRPYLWKTLFFGATLTLGVVLGDLFARQVGMQRPLVFDNFRLSTVAAYLLLISPVLLAGLIFLCRYITGNFFAHWLTLAVLTWLVYSLGTTVSKPASSAFEGPSPYVVTILFFASFLGVGVLVLLFPEHYRRPARPLVRR